MKRNLIFLFTITGFGLCINAQKPAVYCSPQADAYEVRAADFDSWGIYLGTIDQLQRLDAMIPGASDEERNAWLLAVAEWNRDNEDANIFLQDFLNKYPASANYTKAQIALADWYFFHGGYGSASLWYDHLDPAIFTPTQKPTYQYRRALSHLGCGDIDTAERLFLRMEGSSRYGLPTAYYLAYIDYTRGDYAKARPGFERVAHLIPEARYHLAQIDFSDGKFALVADNAVRLLSTTPPEEYVPELQRLAGESLFRLGRTAEAEYYLRKYINNEKFAPANSAVYDLGVIYYYNGSFEEARNLFSTLAEERDAIGQGANLYLGQCETLRGNDKAAAIYYRNAYERNFDNNVAETAFYDYLSAVTRGGNVPFSSSIDMLEDFQRNFPGSRYAAAVDEYLATAYYNERNFPKALASISRISNPSPAVLEAKQKILYELGVQELSNGQAKAAEGHFSEAISLSHGDASINREACLWLGDARFQLGEYARAANDYRDYLAKAPKGDNKTLATYNLAYALYMQGKYREAAAAFADALKASPALPAGLANDARIRRADCLYYTADYKGASDEYSRAIANGASESDYAVYRRAVVYGLLGDNASKLRELESMPRLFPHSRWLPAATLEQAVTYQGENNSQQAVATYSQLVNSYPEAPESRAGMMRLAETYARQGKTPEAMQAYQDVISRWPTSEEASQASADLRRLYAAEGDLRAYADFMRSIPNAPAVDEDELDKASFEAAEIALANTGSTALLQRYVADYPQGRYLAQAASDLAESAYANGDNQKALEWVTIVLDRRPDSPQAPAALALKAQILEDDDNPSDALAAWRQLLARNDADFQEDAEAGIMRLTPDAVEQLKYARRLLEDGARDPQMREEARFFEALALAKCDETREAEKILSELTADGFDSLYAARAAVELGQMYLDGRQTDKALAILDKFTDKGTPHQYWLARGFIALADACHAKGDTSLGRQYLEWMKKNYPGNEPDIFKMIDTRLNAWR